MTGLERCLQALGRVALSAQVAQEGARTTADFQKAAGGYVAYQLEDARASKEVAYRRTPAIGWCDDPRSLGIPCGSRCFATLHGFDGRSRFGQESRLYVRLVICSEISPIRKMMTAALNSNVLILVRRCVVANV